MNTPPLRLGLIGAGAARPMYAPGLKHLPGVRMAAAADTNRAALNAARAELGTTALYESAEAMLRAEKLDGVLVASPPFCHLEHVRLAAAAGVPVLCEKPMARTAVEARAMVDACRGAGVALMMAFNRRYLPPLWTASEMIRAGELGEVFSTECIWTSCTPGYSGWRDDATCLGGVFQDHGAHSVDLAAQWLGAPVESVYAQARRLAPRFGNPQRAVEDHMSALFTHAGGATSLHVHSRVSHRPVSEMYRIYGTKGTLELEYTGDWAFLAPDAWRMELFREGHQRPLRLVARRPGDELLGVLSDGAYGYYAELKAFAEGLRERRAAIAPTGEEGLAVVEAISAAFLSAAEHRVVPIGEAGRFDETVFGRLWA